MKIALLGHPDIASLCAMSRVVLALPDHAFTVFLSPAITAGDAHPEMLALSAYDEDLCRQFLAGDVPEPIIPARCRVLDQPNVGSGHAELRDLAPDLIVSIRFRRILHAPAIVVPRLGVINLHSGILPDYRGVMATFWAMLEGAGEFGSTLHYIIDSGIDTGPVIRIDRQPLDLETTYLENVLRLYPRACASIARTISTLANGDEPPSSPQRHGGAYFSSPGREDVDAFIARGLRLCDGTEVCPSIG